MLGRNVTKKPIIFIGTGQKYEDLEEFQRDFSSDYETVEDIEQATVVISIYAGNGSFIIQNF